MAEEVHDPISGELVAYRYGGMYDFNISIEIGAKSTLDREFFTDLITKALRVDLRRKIEAEGVLIKNIRYGGESIINYDSNYIYISSVNLSTWSEWYETITLLPGGDVKIN